MIQIVIRLAKVTMKIRKIGPVANAIRSVRSASPALHLLAPNARLISLIFFH